MEVNPEHVSSTEYEYKKTEFPQVEYHWRIKVRKGCNSYPTHQEAVLQCENILNF